MTAAPASSDYLVRELAATDEAEVLALLTASLAGGPTGERTAAFLDWKHRQNPAGSSPGLVAVAPDGTLAAVRLLLRWDLRLGEQPVRAVRAVDTATHPDHQGRGLFRRLTLQALETVASDAELVFNTPNGASRPGYLKMGWQVVGELPVRLRPVRPLRFARGLRGTGQSAVTGPEQPVRSDLVPARTLLEARGEEVRALLAAVEAGAPQDRLRTPLTLEHLLWRYARSPGLDYRAVVVDDTAGLRALGLGRLRRRGPLAELTLGAVLHAPDDPAGASAVLRGATRSGADHVAVLLPDGSPLRGPANRNGYLPVPGRGLVLTTRPQVPLPVDPARPSSWALTLGDLEVF